MKRIEFNKLRKGNSTKAERRFMELLKRFRIPFKAKVIIEGREVDFLINNYWAIDIDGHPQDALKNEMLMRKGYCPIHYNNCEVTDTLNITYLWH